MADSLPPRPEPPLPLGISECLLGEPVRYDGAHKRGQFPHDALAGLFTYSGVCPEVAIGLGVPRAPIRLEASAQSGPRARSAAAEVDDTWLHEALRDTADRLAPRLRRLAGYVFMKNSPSCGLFRVKVYAGSGPPRLHGRGVYAARVTELLPQLPVEECGRLQDPVLRENFVTRCFAYAHWQALDESGLSARRLIAFHSRYKFLLLAHSPSHYQRAGVLLADLKTDLAGRAGQYLALLMSGLAQPATRGSHANVLSHLQGYLKAHLEPASRQELAALVEAYRRGEQPLLAVLTLLRHHFRRFPSDYVDNQAYLEPHPPAAGLRRPL